MKKKTKFYEYPFLPFKYILLGLYAPFDYLKKTVYIFGNMEKFEELIPEDPKPVKKVKPPKIEALSAAKVYRPTAVVPVKEKPEDIEKLNISTEEKIKQLEKQVKPKTFGGVLKNADKPKVFSPLAGTPEAILEERKLKGIKQRDEFLKHTPEDKAKFMKEAKERRQKQLNEEKMRLRMQRESEKKSQREAKLAKKYQHLKVLVIENDANATVRSKTKRLYRYLARDIEGRVIKGKFYATAKIEVHSFLMSEGFEVYSIELDPLGILNAQVGSVKLKTKDIIFFVAQLSTYLKAGIPLTDAVRLLSKQAPDATKQTLFQCVVYELTMGASFSQALERQGSSFPRLLINMIKTSELTGGLTEVLDDMENYYKSTEKTKRQMVSALTYPMIVAIFSVLIIVFILIYVIPNFVGIYEGANIELPVITQIIITTSAFLKTNILYIIVFFIMAIIAAIVSYKHVMPFRMFIQYLMMHVPVFKDIIIYNEVTMFTKTFASLLHHDVYITDSMEILGNISNNEIYKYIINTSVNNLQRGDSISLAFKNQWAFPLVAYEMLLTGEKTGELAVMMDKVADYYQDLHANLVTQLKAFIEPVMIVTLTVVVGGVLLAVIIPMFNLYSEISAG